MTVKVLITNNGQQIISEVKQVEQKESKEVIAYWLINPRVVSYNLTEDEQVNVNFGAYCLISNETEFSLKSDHVVAILEPRPEVLERYNGLVESQKPEDEEETTEEATEEATEDEPSTDTVEDGADTDSPE